MKERILYPHLQFDHSVDLQIRFSDYDTFGHINNNSYLAFFDVGKTEFFHHIFNGASSPDKLSAAIVNINVDFLASAIVGEPLKVLTAVVKLGERSFTLYQQVVNSVTNQVKSQATSVLTGFDIPTQTSAPLLPRLVSALRRFLKE